MRIENNLLVKVDDSDITNGTLILSQSLTSIGDWAFKDCRKNLITLILPQGLTFIGDFAFSSCSNLSILTLPQGLTYIGNCAFSGCSKLSTLTLPQGLTSIDGCAFYRCSNLSILTLPESLISIGASAFEYCSNLSSLTLPQSLTSIGPFAFKDCSNLSILTLPQSLTSIGLFAFKDCSNLSILTLPQSLTYIGNCAFSGCSKLSTLTLPQGLTSIDYGAFRNCSNLSTLSLPQSLTCIGKNAFEGCSNLNTIIVMADSDADFKRIKALLPQDLQSLAYNGSKQALEEMLSPLRKLLQDKPNGIEDEKDLAQIVTIMNTADAHLERISTHPNAYAEQKKIVDILYIKTLLHQRNTLSALAYYLDNRGVDEQSVYEVAEISYVLEDNDIDPDLKAKAMIALFKDHAQLDGINILLTQMALYLLSGVKPKLGDTLSTYDIEHCAPLSLIHSTAQTAVNTLDDTNPLKEMLLAILAQLEHLTRQELLHLFSLSPIQEALVANPALHSAKILPFEFLYKKETTTRELPDEPEFFIATTLERIGTEKPSTQDTIEFIEEHVISQLKATLAVLTGDPVPFPSSESSGTSPHGFFTDPSSISVSAEDEPRNSLSPKGK